MQKKLGLSIAEQRTISIEVGMQNSGTGSGLAKTPAFAAQFTSIQQAALAPVPAAISAVWHVLMGSILLITGDVDSNQMKNYAISSNPYCASLWRILANLPSFGAKVTKGMPPLCASGPLTPQ